MKNAVHTKAFTLIELLVVISIISLLISILLPALGAARQAAQSTKCLANLKQVGIMHVMYDGDTGSLPVYGEYSTDLGKTYKSWNWRYYVLDYTQTYAIYDCPTMNNATGMLELLDDTDRYASEGSSQWSRWQLVEYGVSSNTLFGSYRYSPSGGGSTFANSYHPARLSDLQNPSKIFSTMDTERYLRSEPAGGFSVTDWRSAPTATGEVIPSARHMSGVNVLWADSHAGTHKVDDPSDPYNTGMSSNYVTANGMNYWNRYN